MRVNKFCKYFPCHKGLEDCTFCYCPLYPCNDENRGKYIRGKVWSCEDCNWIHQKKIVDKIFRIIKKNIEEIKCRN